MGTPASYSGCNDGGGRVAVRVFSRWIDDPTECPFAFDVILDPATARISGRWPIFGAMDLDGPKRRPFVLEPDGGFDFGSQERRWRTDLRDHALRAKARFTIWWTDDDPAIYEVVKIAALGGKIGRRADRSRTASL